MQTYDVVILDVMNHAHRCWWPLRDSTTHLGRDNSLERGFIAGIVALLQRYFSALFVLAWDGRPTRQIEENPTYKADRADKHANRPPDWHSRCDRLREALAGVFHTVYDPAGEADQEIARFIKRTTDKRILVISTDADLLMLLNDHVNILRPTCKTGFYCAEDFQREYGFMPESFVLCRALVGDKSDNIRGLFRFPKAAAKSLAASFRTVDRLYQELRRNPVSAAFKQLTVLQRQSLLAAEQQVRSNARLIDLLAETAPSHLSRPAGDHGPLLSLLRDLDLTNLADAVSWELNARRNQKPRESTSVVPNLAYGE
jgi:DNA polymerase-1